MADSTKIIDHVILVEGGLKLIHVRHDRGGQTFAGISRRAHPDWEGWAIIDSGASPSRPMVDAFYKGRYWDRIRGDDIHDQDVAEMLMSSAVLSGRRRAIKMAQMVVEAQPDGVIGPKTLAAINQMDPDLFEARFALARIDRYRRICNADRRKNPHKPLDETQVRFLLGWTNRVFGELETTA